MSSNQTVAALKSLGLHFNSQMLTGAEDPRREWHAAIKAATSKWAIGQPRPPQRRRVGGAPKKRWTLGEDSVLRLAVSQLGQENWREVARNLAGRSPKQCRVRWLGYFAPGLVRDAWTPAEDVILVEKHAQFGSQWSMIRQFLPGRHIIGIKNRWQWLCRRNVPNHSMEFCGLALEHEVERIGSCEGVKRDFETDDSEYEIQFDYEADTEL
jgi:hypothetical protein